MEKPLKPAQFAEHQLLTGILTGTYQAGTSLPAERTLAENLGVTRPTLRETLQRMNREGWVTIHHGKPTIVNDYIKEGGMGLLSTMVKYGEYLPDGFVGNFLMVRRMLLPPITGMAVRKDPESIIDYLEKKPAPGDNDKKTGEEFITYDWNLHLLLATLTGNPLFRMILNDFSEMFKTMGALYFASSENREISLAYYRNLLDAVKKRDHQKAETLSEEVMISAEKLWDRLMPTAS